MVINLWNFIHLSRFYSLFVIKLLMSLVLHLQQIDVIVSLISGRLVRERIGPAMLSAVQSQVRFTKFDLAQYVCCIIL